MIIAIASAGKELNSLIAESFGRSEYFTFYNTDEKNCTTLRNPFSELLDGAGIQTAQFVIENNVASVIVNRIGIKSFRTLKSAEVNIFKCLNNNLEKTIEDYLQGYLKEIIELPDYPFEKIEENINLNT
jgi:predicted Fe-Mo cluster-binding NifX family protein